MPGTVSHPIFHNAVASKYEERSREVNEDVRAPHDQIMIDRTLEPLVKDGMKLAPEGRERLRARTL